MSESVSESYPYFNKWKYFSQWVYNKPTMIVLSYWRHLAIFTESPQLTFATLWLYMAHVPVYSDIVLHFPSRLAFRALTSKSYFTRELRPHSLVRSMHITGAFNVSLVKLSSLLFPDGLKRTSYAVTSFAVFTLFGLSQFRVSEGLFVSRVDFRFWTCPGTRPVQQTHNNNWMPASYNNVIMTKSILGLLLSGHTQSIELERKQWSVNTLSQCVTIVCKHSSPFSIFTATLGPDLKVVVFQWIKS